MIKEMAGVWLDYRVRKGGGDGLDDEVQVKQGNLKFYFAYSLKPENLGDRERQLQRCAFRTLIYPYGIG